MTSFVSRKNLIIHTLSTKLYCSNSILMKYIKNLAINSIWTG